MSRQLVVCRYKEDTRWISQIYDLFDNVIVYNKFAGENLLPNINREAHTIVYHLCKKSRMWTDQHYDHIYFSQGNPLEHVSDLRKCVEDTITRENEKEYESIVGTTLVCDKVGDPHMNPYFLEELENTFHYIFGYGSELPKEIEYDPYAMFRVSTKLINNFQVEDRLNKAMVILSGPNFVTNEFLEDTRIKNRIPWIMERLFKMIFTKDIIK